MANTESNQHELTNIIQRFTDAEAAMRDLLDAGAKFTTASGQVAEAADQVQAAQRHADQQITGAVAALDGAERGLKDTTSAVYGMTAELKDIARELKDTAIAFRSLQPERLWTELSQVQASQRRQLMVTWAVLVAAIASVAAAFIR